MTQVSQPSALEWTPPGASTGENCDVARTMAPHSVGHDEEIVLFHDDERVFVVLPLEPDVAQAGRHCTHQSAQTSK